jgi:hypothetical protein
LLLRADQGASAASASNIIMQVDGTERLRIDSTGNVGVGTSSPESHLDVTGTNGILISANKTDATGKTGRLRFKHYLNAEEPITGLICPSSASATSLFVGGGSGSENAVGLIKFYTAADNVTVSGTERMVIDGSGNVGIGTTSPASRFHIAMDDSVGGINTILRVANLNATRYTSAMSFTSSPGNDWKIGKGAFSNDQDFAIGLLSGTELLRLNTSGNIGIGTVTPGQKLSVVGTIESTSGGFKFPDGTIQTTASAGGGGGGVTVKTSTINVASGVYQQYTTSIVDASVSTSSNLNAWLAPNTDWDADDLIGYDVRLTPQTGSIDVCISAPGPIVGDFSLKYFIA